ncbi:MAG TPA: AAA family ATPase [Propionibacteriaceae bacterium]
MSQIFLATATADVQKRIQAAMSNVCLALPAGPLPPSPAALFAQLESSRPPEVIVLDSGADPTSALQLAARFDEQCPAVSVVLVTGAAAQVGLDALRAGVRDILEPHADADQIRLVLRRATDAAQTRAAEPAVVNGAVVESPSKAGRVISVVSPKGGVGKTTVATNLAVGLAKTAPNSTVLVDLDVQFGDVASALDLDPEYCLPDAVQGPASRDTMLLKTFLTLHETGLYVICGAKSPAAADSITGEEVSRLLQMLASEFAYVVVDTAPGLSEHVLAAMDQSSDLIMVTSMDVPGVRGLRKEIDALGSLGMLGSNDHVVLNMADGRGGLTLPQVETTLGVGVDVVLPRSKAALQSVNQGVPLMQSGVRDPMTKQLRGLVTRFATPQPAVAAAPVVALAGRAPGKVASPPPAQPKRAALRWYQVRRMAG